MHGQGSLAHEGTLRARVTFHECTLPQDSLPHADRTSLVTCHMQSLHSPPWQGEGSVRRRRRPPPDRRLDCGGGDDDDVIVRGSDGRVIRICHANGSVVSGVKL